MTCPFLERPEADWIAGNALAFAIRNAYPVIPGRSLVVPRRLFRTWFDVTPEERQAILDLVDR
jgi:diadenosine tetraphosphate (Ap4A) HIT family hydrolase